MSLLRTKYYSIQTQTFIDIPTDPNNIINSADIGNVYNDETIRLVRFESNIESGKIDELISDLVYNDKKLYDQFQKINSLLSDGVFYAVGDNFKIYDIKKEDFLDGTYIESFGIRSGQIKYQDEIIFLESPQFYKNITFLNQGAGLASGTSFFNVDSFTGLELGSVIFSSDFPEGTEIIGITGTMLQLSNMFTSQSASGTSLVSFMNIPTFKIGRDIDEIGNYDLYPIWRRDLISYDINNSKWDITKGPELLNLPSLNTQLDVLYQIESIIHQSSDLHLVKLKKNNRTLLKTTNPINGKITGDFSVGDYIQLDKTNNNFFDGKYEIKQINVINNQLLIRIPLIKNGSKDQTESGGYVNLGKLGIFSILVYKASDNSPSVIIDSIQNILNYSGITGGIQNIIRAQIDSNDNLYSIKTNDSLHLIDIEGRLLDWEEGQSNESQSNLGYKYNEDNLTFYELYQVPFPEYAPIESGMLSNIPLILEQIDNNVFGFNSVSITDFNVGIKNSSISIGEEGLTADLITFDQLSDEITVQNSTVQRNSNNKIIRTLINNPTINFSNLGISLERKDFILIIEGSGSFQIGKITEVGNGYLQVINLFKELDSTSKYIIFKNQTISINNSEISLDNDTIKSQTLTGINGVFGEENIYSKVNFKYSSIKPNIFLKKWYFIRLKSYSELPNQQGSPFILVESTSNESIVNSSAFIETFYQVISGKYPNGNFLIEDEFGDIGTTYLDREESPHFRPTKYKISARSLDESFSYPQNIDEVFVDVHIGKIKFHPSAKPRKLFVSYNKFDVIDGNSSDFSIKHIDVKTGLKTNLQDKISEIDSRFNSETEITKTWKVNGLISSDNSGFLGPFSVNENNPYEIIYKDDFFNNFSYDEENYGVKLSNHTFDNSVYLGKNSVILDSTKLEVTNIDDNFISAELVSNLDFLDYTEGVSGVTLPQAGINFYDEIFLPVNTNFFNLEFLFYRKKNIFEKPNEKSLLAVDSGLYNPNFGVDSTWNYLYSSHFNKNTILYGLLRKTNYEELIINANLDIKRRLRQREFIKILDSNLNDLDNYKSSTQIISEKFLSKSLILDSIKYKENSLLLKTEITKYREYKFLPSQDLNGDSLSLNNNDAQINGVFDSSFKRGNIFLNNLLITAYLNPVDSNRPYFKIIKFEKSEETSDVSNINKIFDSIKIDSNNYSFFDIKICQFNESNYFAVGYVYQLESTF